MNLLDGEEKTSSTGLNLDELLLDSWQPMQSPSSASSSYPNSIQNHFSPSQYVNQPDTDSAVYSAFTPSSCSYESSGSNSPKTAPHSVQGPNYFDSILSNTHSSNPSNDFVNIDMMLMDEAVAPAANSGAIDFSGTDLYRGYFETSNLFKYIKRYFANWWRRLERAPERRIC